MKNDQVLTLILYRFRGGDSAGYRTMFKPRSCCIQYFLARRLQRDVQFPLSLRIQHRYDWLRTCFQNTKVLRLKLVDSASTCYWLHTGLVPPQYASACCLSFIYTARVRQSMSEGSNPHGIPTKMLALIGRLESVLCCLAHR